MNRIYSVIPHSDKKPPLRVVRAKCTKFEIVNGVHRDLWDNKWIAHNVVGWEAKTFFYDDDYGDVFGSYREAMLYRLEKYSLSISSAIKHKHDKVRHDKYDQELPVGIMLHHFRGIKRFVISGFDGEYPRTVYIGKYEKGSDRYNRCLSEAMIIRSELILNKTENDFYNGGSWNPPSDKYSHFNVVTLV
jgi:hypothetical protein